MRAWALCVCVLGCSPVEVPEHAALRQGFGLTPDFIGSAPGARLGQSVSACRGTGFVAGAPGLGTVIHTRRDGGIPAVGGALGTAVVCEGTAGAPLIVAGGLNGAALLTGANTWQYFTTSPVVSLALSDGTSLPLLVGESDGTVRLIDLTSQTDVALAISIDGGLAPAIAWAPSTTKFAVGFASLRRVILYDFAGASMAQRFGEISEASEVEFGRAVAFGDVSPRGGIEVIVSSLGAVHIFQVDGTWIETLTGADLTFGSSLAVERGYTMMPQPLDALWVGEPGRDQVYRFIGDAGTISTSLVTPISFGQGVALDGTRMLAVGAPRFPATVENGGVYFEQVSPAPLGYAMECDAGEACRTPDCNTGQCIGGVFCQGPRIGCPTSANCVAGVCRFPGMDAGAGADAGDEDGGADAGLRDAGVPDAGAPDAGAPDAGAPDAGAPDAGAPDAGAPDAGVSDAGGPADAGSEDVVLRFGTRSCSTAPSLPLALLALVFAFRRRGRADR